jgi:predicted nucleic acid-binding protein
MSVLVDSDILIEVSRGRDPEIVSRWLALSRQDIAVLYSPVSAAELWAGARPAENQTIVNLFRALTCVPIDAATGNQAGEYIRLYQTLQKEPRCGTRRRLNRRYRRLEPIKPVDAQPKALPNAGVGVLLVLLLIARQPISQPLYRRPDYHRHLSPALLWSARRRRTGQP